MTELFFSVVMMERIFLQIRLEDISLQHMVIAQVLQHPQQLIVPLVLQQKIQDLTRDVDNTFGPSFQGGAGYASQNWLTLPKGTTTERFPDLVLWMLPVLVDWIAWWFSNRNVIEYITIINR